MSETPSTGAGAGAAAVAARRGVRARPGAVCQPKTELPATQGFAPGDDLVNAPDGSIVWANVDAGRIQLVR